MKSGCEKSAFWLTIPSLVGIVMAVLWIFVPLREHREFPYGFAFAQEALLDAWLIVGLGTSVRFFCDIKYMYRKMRISVISACCIINVIWILYVTFCVTHPGPFHMQK
jgi:hypothetical protein